MGMKTLSLSLLTVVASLTSNAQQINPQAGQDSLSNRASYQLWFDVGLYPFGSHQHARGFGPTFNIRLGVGRSFRIVQLYGFLEFTDHTFDQPDAPSYYTSSGRRRDFALYASGIAFSVLFAGGGVYYTHQDNIITRYRDSKGTIADESGVRSRLALYYLLGLQYQFELLSYVSVPIGLYFRDQGNPSSTFPGYQVSMRLGIIYHF